MTDGFGRGLEHHSAGPAEVAACSATWFKANVDGVQGAFVVVPEEVAYFRHPEPRSEGYGERVWPAATTQQVEHCDSVNFLAFAEFLSGGNCRERELAYADLKLMVVVRIHGRCLEVPLHAIRRNRGGRERDPAHTPGVGSAAFGARCEARHNPQLPKQSERLHARHLPGHPFEKAGELQT